MNKTDEELNQAEKMAKRHGVLMCDENGDTHGEELYCVGIDDIADIIREALADHIADTGKMIGCAYCDNPLFAGTKCNNCGRVTIAEPANTRSTSEYLEPVKQEPVAWAYIDADGSFMDALDRQHGAYQTPPYAAPVDAKAIRAEALEEAAKVCEQGTAYIQFQSNDCYSYAHNRAAAIRGMK